MTWKFIGPISDTKRLAYLVEALKVEGYWSVKDGSVSIQNGDVGLLKYLENIFLENKQRVRKRYLIKIKPQNQDFLLSDVKIKFGSKLISSHIEYSPFDKSKKIVFNLPFASPQSCLIYIGKQRFRFKVYCKSKIEMLCNKPSFAYVELRVNSVQFSRFLERSSGGRGAHKIRMTPTLNSASPEVTASAFSALVDCEGTIDMHKLKRGLRIRMVNKLYLQDWKDLLTNHSIESNLGRDGKLYCLTIYGFQDFKQLMDIGFSLKHSKKSVKFSQILSSYIRRQISRGSAEKFYIDKIKEFGIPISANDFALSVGKSKRVVNHHFTRLLRKGLLQADKSKDRWLYFAS